MGLGVTLGLPASDPTHADRVYRLDQLADLVAQHGLPADTAPGTIDEYEGHERGTVDAYIEIQLGADQPIARYLATSGQDL